MEAAGSILEKEEWLDFLPTKTLENPLNVAAEVGIAIIKFLYIKSELENWPTFWHLHLCVGQTRPNLQNHLQFSTQGDDGGVMAELGRIFFSNAALTVNLTPFLLIAALATLGEEFLSVFVLFFVFNITIIKNFLYYQFLYFHQFLSTRVLTLSSGSTSSSTQGRPRVLMMNMV